MFLLRVCQDGRTLYYGPFPSVARAEKYMEMFSIDNPNIFRWAVHPLIIPNSIVSKITWREKQPKNGK